ncbi:MAG: InlB B-repeat-containing protein [Clostridiales bacterium]|nr:InlB B-repeat-containing protein [Clostridiales bacterium]
MKKSKLLVAALAATMFTTAACALVACGDDDSTGNTYTVTFDADGGSISGSKTLTTDASGFVQGDIPAASKADYTFQGWSLSKGDDTIINFKSQKFTDDKVVYAVYTPGAGEVTVTFDYGDGSGAPASAQTVNGKLTSLPTPTVPQDCVFNGWYTAEAGGEYVTTNTSFSQSCTIYARYKSTIAERNNYCYVGSTKHMLTATTVEGAEQAYTVHVELNEGNAISFYVDVELIEAQRGAIWLGMEAVTEKTGEFTAAKQGTFDFTLAYYAEGGDWKIEADDGTIPFQANHFYLVGAAFGWNECSADGYIGATSGTYELTVGDSPVVFKIAKCANGKTGAILWDDSVLDVNSVTEGLGYLSAASDQNIRLAIPGTYTITVGVDGHIEITSDTEEPALTIHKDHYYMVGEGLDYINWGACTKDGYLGATSGEIELTVGEEPVKFKIVKSSDMFGTIDWDTALNAGDVTKGAGYLTVDHDPNGDVNTNIRLETAGTYRIKLVDGKIEIENDDFEEPPVAIFVGHYYLVNADFGWTCVEDGHLGATSGQIDVKVTEDADDTEEPFAFKIVKCNSLAGGVDWSSAVGMSTVGKGYVTTDGDGNFVIKKAGDYTIKLVNGKIEITSENVEDPGIGGGESSVDNSSLTFEECSGEGAWLVGVIQEKDQTWTTGYGNGFKMERADDDNNQQYKIEVYLQAGDEVKIRFNKTADTNEGVGYSEISNSGDLDCIENADGNIAIKTTGKYTFYFKFTWTSNDRIYLIFEAAE